MPAGLRVRDIQSHLERTLGTELSHETLSNITETVAEEVKAWQTRPLDPVWPVVFLDTIVVKVRDGAHVVNRHAHIAIGIDTDGIKHVLGIWIQATEGAKFWASVCAQLANRGVKTSSSQWGHPRTKRSARGNVMGLEGLPEAI